MTRVQVMELTAYDESLPGERTLYLATRGFTSATTDTPASTYFMGRLKQAVVIDRSTFTPGALGGRSSIGAGEAELENLDGELDGWIAYAFDGRDVVVREGEHDAAYPAGYDEVLVGTVEAAEFTPKVVRLRLRERTRDFSLPMQETKFAGDNVPPDGVEGEATDLGGKPKPLVFGTVKNIAPPRVNKPKLIYQLSDRPLASVDGVYDRGIELGSTLFVHLGYADSGIGTSKGADFTAHPYPIDLPGVAGVWRGGCSDGSHFIAVDGSGAGVITWSTDGQTWDFDTRTMPGGLYGIGFGGSLYVIVGDGFSASSIYTSPGPLSSSMTWTARTSNFTGGTPRAICHSGALWCVVGTAGQISTSADGVTWTARTSGTATAFRSVCFAESLFVAVGDLGIIFTSSDGTTWTSRTSNVSTALRSVIHDGTRFIAAGDDGAVTVSEDGLSWVARVGAMPTTFDITHLAFGDDSYIAVGRIASGPRAAYRSSDTVAWTPIATGLPDSTTSANNDYGVVLFRDDVAPVACASEADLLNDTLAPLPGMYRAYLAGGMIRLGLEPSGLVTCDATEGATAADRTVAQVFLHALEEHGYSAADWVAVDFTALDAAVAGEVGLFVDIAERSIESVLNEIAATAGAWWGADHDGKFRLQQLLAPSGVAALELTADDLVGPPERVVPADRASMVPSYRSILRYARNWTPQQTDLAFAIEEDRKAFVAQEWREVSSEDATVQTKHLLAQQVIEDSLFVNASDAQTEVDRRQALRGTHRDVFRLTTKMAAATLALDLGQVISLTHRRYGLSAGKLFRIIGVKPDALKRHLTFTVWG